MRIYPPLIIYARGLLLYLLFTSPLLVEPGIYCYSALIAILFSLVAGALFTGFYRLISTASISFGQKIALLYLALFIAVSFSYLLTGYCNRTIDAIGLDKFLVFPTVALVSGWSSLFISRRTIRVALNPAAKHYNN